MHTTIPEQRCEEAGVPLSDSSWPGPSEADVLAMQLEVTVGADEGVSLLPGTVADPPP